MRFPDPLLPGTLIRRYKRFLADVTLQSGAQVTAHCANPGSMLGLAEPGMEVWLSPARNPDRKLRYSWELVRVGDGLVGVHTAHPNPIVAEAVDGRAAVLLDGGIRRGNHVIKALALGADCCLIGRPQFWGLAVGGEAGVAHVLEIFRREIDLAMGLSGLAKISDIDRDILLRKN